MTHIYENGSDAFTIGTSIKYILINLDFLSVLTYD